MNATTSSLAPLAPVTEKLPRVARYRVGSPPFSATYRALTSSASLAVRPTAVPSKYSDHVPAVSIPERSRSECQQIFVLARGAGDRNRTGRRDQESSVGQFGHRVDVFARAAQADVAAVEVERPGAGRMCRPAMLGVKSSRSSPPPVSVPPPAAGTLNAPFVEMMMLPSARNAKASTSSVVVVRPTSLPSKCIA